MAKVAAATLTLSCLLVFVLLVITSASAPASRDIYLFKIVAEEANGAVSLEAGILGICFGIKVPTQGINLAACSTQILGYPVVIPEINADGTADLTGKTAGTTLASAHLTRAMIFTPIGAVLSGLATLVSGIAWASKANRGLMLGSMVLASLTAVCSWLAFAVNIAVSSKVKQGFSDLPIQAGESLKFRYGAATFLPLVAAIILTAALGLAFVAHKKEKREIQRKTSESGSPFETEEIPMDEKPFR